MIRKEYDLFLDESGDFNDTNPNRPRPQELSLVGGLLAVKDVVTNEFALSLLPKPVHCCDGYKKWYLDVLDTLSQNGCRFVIFENKERLKVVNGDITYLNIISEGLVKLFRDLSNEAPEGVSIHVTIATRKAMNAARGIIPTKKYREELEEKILMAFGRNHVNGCEYTLSFEDARTYKQIDFADIICNTWLTRHRNTKFTDAEQARIERLYAGQFIYPVFEDAMTTYIKQLLLERHYGEAIYQICTLPRLTGFTALRNRLVQTVVKSDAYEQETMFGQMSLYMGQYNRMRLYLDGIKLTENYIRYFLDLFAESEIRPSIVSYWRFDADFYLLTMYDHIGNAAKCQHHLQACQVNISSINRSWEHIDYYFRFCIRELNVLMGRFAFEEVLRRTDDLINIFTEARDLFSLIKTYNGTEQPIRSELLGKVYGVRTEAIINLLHRKPELFDAALDASDKAFDEFSDPRDISRQYQWRCLLMVGGKKPEAAHECLLKAVGAENEQKPIGAFLSRVFSMKTGTYDFLLWHYTNVMLLWQEYDSPQAEEMANALIHYPQFSVDVENENKKGHPWNLVLWNVARFVRRAGDISQYKKLYRKAMTMTLENKANVTMLTFALSMSADRLLWCREHETKDTDNAQIEFMNVCKELKKAGMTDEMISVFHINEVADAKKATSNVLNNLSVAYLK